MVCFLRELDRYYTKSMMICPKCRYERKEHDAAVHAGVCPACGIAYAKWLEAQAAQLHARSVAADSDTGEVAADALPAAGFWRRARDYISVVPQEGQSATFWARVVMYVLFVIWGFRFIVQGVDAMAIGSSLLHNINLPFHEFGHLFFSPLGTFWRILGGSLFQILLPLLPLVYFTVWQRDNFSASLMLWWSAQNFIDVAPYIADAQLRALPLTTGNDDSHDWWNLLSMTGTLDFADYYANLSFTIGVGVMLLSHAWCGYLLFRVRRLRRYAQP
jgi:hypothetical protein